MQEPRVCTEFDLFWGVASFLVSFQHMANLPSSHGLKKLKHSLILFILGNVLAESFISKPILTCCDIYEVVLVCSYFFGCYGSFVQLVNPFPLPNHTSLTRRHARASLALTGLNWLLHSVRKSTEVPKRVFLTFH